MNSLKTKFMKFMKGRYGPDILGRDLLFLAIGLMIVNFMVANQILRIIPFIILLVTYFRMFSKNFAKRYNENRVYTNFKYRLLSPFSGVGKFFKTGFKRLKDFPKYKYKKCPSCAQTLRLPRGKKEIIVTCPKCKHKFETRT